MLAVVLGLTVFGLHWASGKGFPDRWWDLSVGAVACLALWWRRRATVAIAVATVLLSMVFPSAGGASLIMLFSLAVHRSTRAAVVVTILAVLSGLPRYLLVPPWSDRSGATAVVETAPEEYWIAFGVSALVCVLAAVAGAAVRAHRRLVVSLVERTRRAEAEQALRVERGRRLERELIAREIHDVLAHRLSLLSMHAGVLEFRPGASREVIVRTASVIRASAHQALEDLREVIEVLRAGDQDAELAPWPSIDRLDDLVRQSREAGTAVEVHDERSPGKVPASLSRTVYRIVQEGLTNARKHAPGQPVSLRLAGRPGHALTVELRNRLAVGDGRGGDRVPGAGLGLAGIAERVELAGGRLEHGRIWTGEFRVATWLPWSP